MSPTLTCLYCQQDSAGNHQPNCPNALEYRIVDGNSVTGEQPYSYFFYEDKDEKIRALRAENEMLRAEVGRLREQLWVYESQTMWS